MSIDLEVWSVNPLRSAEGISELGLKRYSNGWSYATPQWQITVQDSTAVDADDAPLEIAANQLGIQYLTHLSLEPSSAPESGFTLLSRIADQVCDRTVGVIHDPQSALLSGPGLLRNPRAHDAVELLEMNWWFLGNPLTTRKGTVELLKCIGKHAPEFLPRRYGQWEPARHRFDQNNLDHLLDLVFSKRGIHSFVWRAAKHVYVHYSPTWGPGWHWLPGIGDFGYAVPRLTFGCPAKVLSTPDGEMRLQTLWGAITTLASPMYGDARILRGYRLNGSQIFAGADSESHPLRGGWRGLPKSLGLAFAVGPPYVRHWPAMKVCIAEGGVAVKSVSHWACGGKIVEMFGPPPDVLCAPDAGIVAPYWPFRPKPAPRK
jgi:hypothetical protein